MGRNARLGLVVLLGAPMIARGAEIAADKTTVLTLSASASVGVTPDRMEATMTATATASTAAAASAAVNRAVATARAAAKSMPSVRFEAQDFNVSRTAAPESRWQGDQTVQLTSLGENDALLRLVGILQQQNLVTDTIDWTIAPEILAERQQQAASNALTALKARAIASAAALGLHFQGFRTISLDDNQLRPMQFARAIGTPTPQVDRPHGSSITVDVRGEALLTP